MRTLTEAAQRLNVPVFPCGADKTPLVAGGFKAATRDRDAITRLFSNPRAVMIGVPTGSPSGVVVVDVDAHGEKNGMGWWGDNEAALCHTRRHRTRSGGLHLLWRAPADGPPIRNSASRIAPGVDVRGEGGYVIVPPSPGYEVEHASEIAPMPRWLAALCQKRSPPPLPPPSYVPKDTWAWQRLMRAVVKVGQAGEGTRNATLNAQAYYVAALVGEWLSRDDALAALFRAARQAGLEEQEIKATLHSAFSSGGRG